MPLIPQLVKRHPFWTILPTIVAIPVLVFCCWAWITLHYTYSSGERAGFLQKLSHKGWLCKTWEGELLLSAVPGSVPEKFLFTTRSDSLASVMNNLSGQRVDLHYEQHKGVPTSCFGDTQYFVTGVRPVGTP